MVLGNLTIILIGIGLAVVQIIIIRSPLKNIIIGGFVGGLVGSYHFFIQPHFTLIALPVLSGNFLLGFGVYGATKAILLGLRLFRILPF